MGGAVRAAFTLCSQNGAQPVTKSAICEENLYLRKASVKKGEAFVSQPQRLALALHDIEPSTFQRCIRIRNWLARRGVERMTLLVIPACDLHPLGERSPQLAGWLLERRRAGDAIAQYGFQHSGARAHAAMRLPLGRRRARNRAEFSRLDPEETRRAVDAGLRVLKLAGIEPTGFVAPAYAYTPALRDAVARRFQWWAERFKIVPAAGPAAADDRDQRSNSSGVAGALERGVLGVLGHRMVGLRERLPGRADLRIDIHPGDFDADGAVRRLERALRCLSAGSRAITYDDLARERPTRVSIASAGERRRLRADRASGVPVEPGHAPPVAWRSS